jgi:hypothetical protein
VAGSGLGAVGTGDAARPAGLTHAVGEPQRQRQSIGYCNSVSIAYCFADPIAIADWFAYAIPNSDGIAIGVPDLVSDAESRADAGSVSELADRRIPPCRDGRRERERQNCAGA